VAETPEGHHDRLITTRNPSTWYGKAPPTIIGGCGFWTGFGQAIIGSKFTNSHFVGRHFRRYQLIGDPGIAARRGARPRP
jgi:hypothetical protein